MPARKSLDKIETPEQKELRELKEQMKELQKLVKSNSNSQVQYQQVSQEDTDIPMGKQVKIMSLCQNQLNLSTEKYGRGHHYSFIRFGETKRIPYVDVKLINENHRNFKEAGYYIILDDKVIEEEGLSDIYSNILNKEKIERVISNAEDALPLFKSTNEKQQKVIEDILVARYLGGEKIDQNLIVAIDKFKNPKGDKNIFGIADRVQLVGDIKNDIESENQ